MSRRRKSNDNPFTLFAFQDIITAVTGILILITLILSLSLVEQPQNTTNEEIEQDIKGMKSNLAALKSDLDQLEQQVKTDQVLIELMAEHGVTDVSELTTTLRNTVSAASKMVMQSVSQTAADERQQKQLENDNDAKSQKLEKLLEQLSQDQALTRRLVKSNRMIYRWQLEGNQKPWLLETKGNEWLLAPALEKKAPLRLSDTSSRTRLAKLETWFDKLPPEERYLILIVRPDTIDDYRLLRASVKLKLASFGTELVGNDVSVIDPITGAKAK